MNCNGQPPSKKRKLSLKYQLAKSQNLKLEKPSDDDESRKIEEPLSDVKCHSTGQVVQHNPVTSPLLHQCFQKQPLIARLENLGHTCYLNSVLSVLRFSSQFTQLLHAASKRLIDLPILTPVQKFIFELHEMYLSMSLMEKDAIDKSDSNDGINKLGNLVLKPTALLLALRDVDCKYEGNEQHDAQELMGLILESVREVCEGVRRKDPSFESIKCESVEDLFQTKFLITTHCLECESPTTKEDCFWEFGIAASKFYTMTRKGKTKTAFNFTKLAKDITVSMQQSEVLNDTNKYNCNNCFHLNEARRVANPIYIPRIISIALKHTNDKEFAAYDAKPAVDAYRIPMTLPCLQTGCCKMCKNKNHRSILYAIICHHGLSTSCGHYSAYIRVRKMAQSENPNGSDWSSCCKHLSACEYLHQTCLTDIWIHIDDESISVIKDVQKLFGTTSANAPCLLLYRRP